MSGQGEGEHPKDAPRRGESRANARFDRSLWILGVAFLLIAAAVYWAFTASLDMQTVLPTVAANAPAPRLTPDFVSSELTVNASTGEADVRPKSTIAKDAPMIAIVIDDMGVNAAHTRIAMGLPSFVTLSFSPEAEESLA